VVAPAATCTPAVARGGAVALVPPHPQIAKNAMQHPAGALIASAKSGRLRVRDGG